MKGLEQIIMNIHLYDVYLVEDYFSITLAMYIFNAIVNSRTDEMNSAPAGDKLRAYAGDELRAVTDCFA